ncbi:MAG: ABC transporter ATP-binding protein [Chloroflexia bacterium]|nr:ABC transporter ATP-binding protein [Chloroflexia bacterium]
MHQQSEFTIKDAYQYNHTSRWQWIIAHVVRYKWLALIAIGCYVLGWIAYAGAQVFIGRAAEEILQPSAAQALLVLALIIMGLLALDGISMLIGTLAAETVASHFEADARQELYASLLGKNKAFHDRQRAGDIMARATDDTQQLSSMIVPGSSLIFETILGILIPITFIALTRLELALVPLGFVAAYILLARNHIRRLQPVIDRQREQYGSLNAGLEESLSGIEVVKASAREIFEQGKFRRNARIFRDLFVQQGAIEARYLPLLVYGVAVGLTFLHAMWLYRQNVIDLGSVITVIGLMNVLRFPTFISIFAFSVFQAGLSSAGRILSIIKAETDLHENATGYAAPMRGAITFEQVSFGYARRGATGTIEAPSAEVAAPTATLEAVSFDVLPGQTVAIVGQTGSGKSALTQLVNRTYDATKGRVLIDGVDVRDWSLDALRSQIGKIEQDIFLFSRSIGENIAFGAPGATQAEIEAAAHAAQAHEFIMSFPDGYATVVGERGVTLSGGQRQRIALARAFLSNPRILILDDSTSAIDSATEDQIQQAIRKAQEGRTVLLITHRLSQIRWADQILVLDSGRLVAAGSHDELLRCSRHYRRIFARFEVDLPPLEDEATPVRRAA